MEIVECVRERNCTAELYRRELEEVKRLDRKRALADLVASINSIRGRAETFYHIVRRELYTKLGVFTTPAGSLIIECGGKGDRYCDLCSALVPASLRGGMCYIPSTILNEDVFLGLPLDYEPPQKHFGEFIAPAPMNIVAYDIDSYEAADALEALASWMSRVSAFEGMEIGRLEVGVKYVHGYGYFSEPPDLLIYTLDGTTVGIVYVDVRETVHMGFSRGKRLLMEGVEQVYVVHPYVDRRFHSDVASRIGNRWDISDLGYVTVDVSGGRITVHKQAYQNRYVRSSDAVRRKSAVLKESLRKA